MGPVAAFLDENTAGSNVTTAINQAVVHNIASGPGAQKFYGGYMAEVVFTDGQALAVTDVGEFDEDSGIWKPKSVSGLTFGNNGFYLDFQDSSALGNDAVGSNNFTANNLAATDQATDTCTNNFATVNILDNFYAAGTFSNGNTTVTTSNSNYARNSSTIGMATGKWYSEYKVGSITGSGGIYIGITGDLATGTGGNTGNSPFSYAYESDGQKNFNGSASSFGNSYTTGDIIGVALDATNSKIWWSKNGVWQASGDPSNGTSPAFTVIVPSLTTIGAYFWSFSDNNSGEYFTCDCNFGNGYFGTTPVSSAGTNASSNGIFEYDVPTGYTALSTKGLNL